MVCIIEGCHLFDLGSLNSLKDSLGYPITCLDYKVFSRVIEKYHLDLTPITRIYYSGPKSIKFLIASTERGAIRAYAPGGSDIANLVSTVPLPREGITQLLGALRS